MYGCIPWVTDWGISLCRRSQHACLGQDMCHIRKHHNGHADKIKYTFVKHVEAHLDIPLSSMPVADDVSVIPSRFLFSHHLSGQMGQLLHE